MLREKKIREAVPREEEGEEKKIKEKDIICYTDRRGQEGESDVYVCVCCVRKERKAYVRRRFGVRRRRR
jgi:hypothetical protein